MKIARGGGGSLTSAKIAHPLRWRPLGGQHGGQRRRPAKEASEGGETTSRFRDRQAAGRELGGLLAALDFKGDPVVLGLPRGGVPVAAEVAAMLVAPLDMFSVRKLGVPGYPELALGAVATGGVRVINEDVLASVPDVDKETIDAITERELAELRRREAAYRGERAPLDLTGRTAILVDDGIATGATMRAAARAARARAAAIVVAAPVASWQATAQLELEVDDVVVAHVPKRLAAVGAHYGDFHQVSDEEVRELLARPDLPAAE